MSPKSFLHSHEYSSNNITGKIECLNILKHIELGFDLLREQGIYSFPLTVSLIANKTKIWISYKDAKKIIKKVGPKGARAFSKFIKDNPKYQNIPSRPDLVYSQWKGWDDFLGN
jgi:hypothetical protein